MGLNEFRRELLEGSYTVVIKLKAQITAILCIFSALFRLKPFEKQNVHTLALFGAGNNSMMGAKQLSKSYADDAVT